MRQTFVVVVKSQSELVKKKREQESTKVRKTSKVGVRGLSEERWGRGGTGAGVGKM